MFSYNCDNWIETIAERNGMMVKITVRYPKETVGQVRHMARKQGVEESHIWRELAEKGLRNEGPDAELGQTTLNLAIQSLCLSRRIAGHLDEDLIVKSKEDAIRTLEKLRGDAQ